MDRVVREARGDPGQRALEVESEDQRLIRRVQRTVEKAVQRAHERIDDHSRLVRHLFRKRKRGGPEQRPEVQVRIPPDGKARINALQQYEYSDRNDPASAINDRIGDRQHGQRMDVREDLDLLGVEHDRAEQSEDHHIADGEGQRAFHFSLRYRPARNGRRPLKRCSPRRSSDIRRPCTAPSMRRLRHSPRAGRSPYG